MKQIYGDLLEIEEGFILQQVNCRGGAGGLAGVIAQKFPDVFAQYLTRVIECRDANTTPLGTAQICRVVGSKLFIVNLFGQDMGGPNTDYEMLEKSLNDFRNLLTTEEETNGQIFYPKIGCGIGGGDWSKVSKILDKTLEGLNHTLVLQ